MSKVLTIGMAVYGEFDSFWHTVRDLRVYHGYSFDILVIDNAPARDPRFESTTRAAQGTYLHRPDLNGTSKPRDACFRFARTPWVMVIDAHVPLYPGAVEVAEKYALENPDSKDIISGPVIGDDDVWISTHWRPPTDLSNALWGTWDCNPVVENLWRSSLSFGRNSGAAIDIIPPFEIPMQGLGLFMMRQAAWPGFNRHFRKFGGEEGYIHEKVRRLGGKAICLPGLRWGHKFRNIVSFNNTPIPYPSSGEDHIRNVLIGHRELGVPDYEKIIKEKFEKKLPLPAFEHLAAEVRDLIPEGKLDLPTKPQRILGIWYSNNAAPAPVITASLDSIRIAGSQSRHNVTVITCPWQPIPNNPFPQVLAKYKDGPGHLNIVRQQRQCVTHERELSDLMGWEPPDIVCFLEHDVLYPPGYFDRIGDAMAANPDAEVVVHDDLIGMNATGYLRHVAGCQEPLHQLGVRYATALENFDRAEEEIKAAGLAEIEPDPQHRYNPDKTSTPIPSDRSKWVRVKGDMTAPAVHINHPNRLTGHGEVCYENQSTLNQNGSPLLEHGYWGPVTNYWPGAAATPPVQSGCGCQAAAYPTPATAEDWVTDRSAPSDFHEHIQTMKDLAAACTHVTEIGAWPKPSLVGLGAGCPGKIVSYHSGKSDIPAAQGLLGDRFVHHPDTDPKDIDQTDLLFVDTFHRAETVYTQLTRYSPKVNKYLIVHCTTQPFGEKGDDGGPGVMPGVRRFLQENQEWVVKRFDENNHGLVVLSRLSEDRPVVRFGVKDVYRYAKAQIKHKLNGGKFLPLPMAQERIDQCVACDKRGGVEGGNCTICKCYLFQLPDNAPVNAGGPGKVFYPMEVCPIGRWHQKPDAGVEMTPDEITGMLHTAFAPPEPNPT